MLDDDGGEVVRRRITTESDRGYVHIVDRVGGFANELLTMAPTCPAVGIGTPGAVSSRTGRMKNCNTVCLNGEDLEADLKRRLGRPVLVENDANCFALAEAVAGAGRGAEMVFGVIMGTGVGGGIVHGGRVRRGPQHIAGEWGHQGIDPSGPPCYCGHRGCVERFISGPAVEARYRALTGTAAGMRDILARRQCGEPAAETVFAEFIDRFGRALANVISILDPDVVVLGGGLSNIDELYSVGRDAVARYVFNDELRTPIRRHALGDAAGVVGAALLARTDACAGGRL